MIKMFFKIVINKTLRIRSEVASPYRKYNHYNKAAHNSNHSSN